MRSIRRKTSCCGGHVFLFFHDQNEMLVVNKMSKVVALCATLPMTTNYIPPLPTAVTMPCYSNFSQIPTNLRVLCIVGRLHLIEPENIFGTGVDNGHIMWSVNVSPSLGNTAVIGQAHPTEKESPSALMKVHTTRSLTTRHSKQNSSRATWMAPC